MNPRSILLILLAVGFAGGTVFVANKWLSSMRAAYTQKAPEPVKKAEQVQVLIAKVDLPAGTLLTEKHLGWQPWPDADLPKSYVVKKPGEAGEIAVKAYFGAVVRQGITLGAPVLVGAVVKPGERGFLAAVLHPGMRAVAVPVNATTGAAGFIFPGDRIDLILTHTISRDDVVRRVSETVLTNVRVIAVDQSANDQIGKAKVAKSVTLEVTPKQVEVVNVVRTLGSLSLSLRALARKPGVIAGEKPIKTSAAMNGEGGTEMKPGEKAEEKAMSSAGPIKGGETGKISLIPKMPFDAATKQPGEKQVPGAVSRIVADVPPGATGGQENTVPGRGTTYTWDNQVSRILQGGETGATPQVTVLRGSKVQNVTITLPNGQTAVVGIPAQGGGNAGQGALGGAQPRPTTQAGGGGQEE